MIAFANQKYFIYIALVAAIVMALYAGYIVWRGVIVSRLLANPVRAREARDAGPLSYRP